MVDVNQLKLARQMEQIVTRVSDILEAHENRITRLEKRIKEKDEKERP